MFIRKPFITNESLGRFMAEFLQFDFPLPADERISHIWNDIASLRHEVYAEELGQYSPNDESRLEDPGNHFIVCMEEQEFVGYVSLNPPSKKPFRLAKYFSAEVLNQTVFNSCDDKSSTFEVRGLTVAQNYRGKNHSISLM